MSREELVLHEALPRPARHTGVDWVNDMDDLDIMPAELPREAGDGEVEQHVLKRREDRVTLRTDDECRPLLERNRRQQMSAGLEHARDLGKSLREVGGKQMFKGLRADDEVA